MANLVSVLSQAMKAGEDKVWELVTRYDLAKRGNPRPLVKYVGLPQFAMAVGSFLEELSQSRCRGVANNRYVGSYMACRWNGGSFCDRFAERVRADALLHCLRYTDQSLAVLLANEALFNTSR